jgi:hypothetical protein
MPRKRSIIAYLLQRFPNIFKTKAQVEVCLLLVVLLCIVLSGILLKNTFMPKAPTPIPDAVQKIS